ncbi:CubicO group peptidase (beta-lactamase class C family) [Catenuloplanes nepalensis]|uniref:CubicO group peptidase (Beta-lactamase class C family) n=1 Tax=Catenuloplanes nepalensis TaxID=587533 RepID=A0ABT9MU61_9ACTN|nr:serine hydrolase domain-containing protein [Catenuloplanes nepalensis]MDP9794954.1 CubicO group peptidase (beta-lactamase class C family) [Catenuloplanes nepalensis]
MEWQRRLTAILDDEAGAGRFSGTVLVTRRDETLFSAAYGLADRERGTPVTMDTRFAIGSVTKVLTATAIVRLIQDGRLSATDPAGRWLPGYPNAELAETVTVHHLLTHTGGTLDIFVEGHWDRRDQLRTPDDHIAFLGHRAPSFAPGRWFDYSNYGYVLLGAIIERAGGPGYLDDAVLRPAGMTRSGNGLDAPDDLAVGYTGEERAPNTDFRFLLGNPAGGAYATAGDLHRFARAILRHELLDAVHTELLTTGKVNMGFHGRQAYGFAEHTVHGIRTIGHGGGFPGANAELTIHPESEHVIVVLANVDPTVASDIARFVDFSLPAADLLPYGIR